ncbi:MAG: hypothetical protein MUO26_10720 [Methanotrichaceae archaeon]|nr:hypothetical protein [Methanotrichaceae archaeon]
MEKVLRTKYPVEYELNPTKIDQGTHGLTLKLKNIGSETLKELDVQLHSLDTHTLSFPVDGTGHYLLVEFKPGEEREVVFQVNAYGSTRVYVAIKARKDGDYFWWESGWTRIYVEEKAELERLLVLSHPYTTIEKTLSATIKGMQKSTGLKLEFWAEPSSGKSEKQAEINIKELSVGEEARYSAEFTPKETGFYTIYAYLFHGGRKIGNKTNFIYVQK